MRTVVLALGLLLSAPALAEQTVILGKFTRQYDLKVKPDCPSSKDENMVAICMDVWFGFEISATKTLSGPPITGRIKVARLQHTLFNTPFFRSLKRAEVLFVLEPIPDANTRKLLKSDYYIVETSSPQGMYCLYKDPASYGLGEITPLVYTNQDPDRPNHCFKIQE